MALVYDLETIMDKIFIEEDKPIDREIFEQVFIYPNKDNKD